MHHFPCFNFKKYSKLLPYFYGRHFLRKNLSVHILLNFTKNNNWKATYYKMGVVCFMVNKFHMRPIIWREIMKINFLTAFYFVTSNSFLLCFVWEPWLLEWCYSFNFLLSIVFATLVLFRCFATSDADEGRGITNVDSRARRERPRQLPRPRRNRNWRMARIGELADGEKWLRDMARLSRIYQLTQIYQECPKLTNFLYFICFYLYLSVSSVRIFSLFIY